MQEAPTGIEPYFLLVLSNFTATLFLIGLIVSGVSLVRKPKPLTGPVIAEALFKWFIFFSIGVSFLYNGFFHIVFGDFAAEVIGWKNSPFQAEVGFASLGFGAVGIIATWRSFDMRVAAILGPALFLWGAAAGHLRDMIVNQNFAPGNAGTIFWSDIILPFIGFGFLWLQYRYETEGRSAAPVPWLRKPR